MFWMCVIVYCVLWEVPVFLVCVIVYCVLREAPVFWVCVIVYCVLREVPVFWGVRDCILCVTEGGCVLGCDGVIV